MGKIKSHLTCDGSQHRFGRSDEAHLLWGTSRFPNCQCVRSVSPRAPPDIQTGCRPRADRGRTACRDVARHYTVSKRRPRGQEALSYNALVQSWPEITRLARASGTPRSRQAQMFEEE